MPVLGILDSQSGMGASSSLREELDGVSEGQGIHAEHGLARNGDGFAAGGDHMEGAGALNHGGGQRADSSQHVLTVVEDHEIGGPGHVLNDGVDYGPMAFGLIDTEGDRHLGGDPDSRPPPT